MAEPEPPRHAELAGRAMTKKVGESAPAKTAGAVRNGEAAQLEPEPASLKPAAGGQAGTVDLLAFADWISESSAKGASEIVDPERTFVSFRLGSEEFGFPIRNVREILRVGDITRVPHAPPYIRGVTNVRGRILPVVEIRTRIGLAPAAPTAASRIVVLEVGSRTLGLLVDGDARVSKARDSQIEPPPEEIVSSRSDYVSGVAKRPEGLLILLDPERTLVVKE
jgi:purine-binding chemotaxis protein CheW